MDTRPRGTGIWRWLTFCIIVGALVMAWGLYSVDPPVPSKDEPATHPANHKMHGSPRCMDLGTSCNVMKPVAGAHRYLCAAADNEADASKIIGQCVKRDGSQVYARPKGFGDLDKNYFYASRPPLKHRVMQYMTITHVWKKSRWSYH